MVCPPGMVGWGTQAPGVRAWSNSNLIFNAFKGWQRHPRQRKPHGARNCCARAPSKNVPTSGTPAEPGMPPPCFSFLHPSTSPLFILLFKLWVTFPSWNVVQQQGALWGSSAGWLAWRARVPPRAGRPVPSATKALRRKPDELSCGHWVPPSSVFGPVLPWRFMCL